MNRVTQQQEKKFKSLFIIFFEGGFEFDQIYEVKIHRSKFQITNFEVWDWDTHISVNITLCEPGLLIGRSGKTIDAFTKYLNDCLSEEFENKRIELNIVESKLWNL